MLVVPTHRSPSKPEDPEFPREYVVQGWVDHELTPAEANGVRRFLATGLVDAVPDRYRLRAVRHAREVDV